MFLGPSERNCIARMGHDRLNEWFARTVERALARVGKPHPAGLAVVAALRSDTVAKDIVDAVVYADEYAPYTCEIEQFAMGCAVRAAQGSIIDAARHDPAFVAHHLADSTDLAADAVHYAVDVSTAACCAAMAASGAAADSPESDRADMVEERQQRADLETILAE